MGCGASKPPPGSAPDKPPTTSIGVTGGTGGTGTGTPAGTPAIKAPERIQDTPPNWLPSIETEYKSLGDDNETKEMRDAFAALFNDDGDDDETMDDSEILLQFRKYDTDKSGTIEKGELRSLLSDTLKLSFEQVEQYAVVILKRLDSKDGTEDGKVQFKVFRKFYRKLLASEAARQKLAVKVLLKASSAESTKQRAHDVFARADKDASGTLTADELSALLREELGVLASSMADSSKWDAFVSDALNRGDKDKSASWDAEEFANFFGKCLAHPSLVEAYMEKVTLRL